MAIIRSFSGLRYNPDLVPDLAVAVSAPYDIIDPSAQRAYYERCPYNVIRLELGIERPGDSTTENRYTRAAQQLAEWKRQGVLRGESLPALYVYEEEFAHEGRRVARRSLLALVRLANWDEGVVLPHEQTLPRAKADRLQLLSATGTQFSPILAMYDDPGSIRPRLDAVTAAPPISAFTLEGQSVAAAADRHRLWAITDPALIGQLSAAFAPLQIYIADGHHRYETALAYRDQQRQIGTGPQAPSEYVLMALIETDDPGLILRPTHRMLRDLGSLDRSAILARIAENFLIERRPATPSLDEAVGRAQAMPTSGSPAFTVLGLEEGWLHRLVLRPDIALATALSDVPKALRSVDTLILQRLIFEAVFGLAPREAEAGERIRYTRDPAEAIRAFATGDAQLVFFLAPTPIAQIREATRAGARMPQKTTYFYPKPVTGLVFYDHALAR